MVIVELYGPSGTGEQISEACEAPGEGILVVDYEYLSMVSDVIRNEDGDTKYARRSVEYLLSRVDELEQELEDQRENLESLYNHTGASEISNQLNSIEYAIATLQTIRTDCKRALRGENY
jgi:hypothetical protein